MLEILKAIIYGVVEGITEWLPVSSTGHLILVEHLLPFNGTSEGFFDVFDVVIQLGAILAVVLLLALAISEPRYFPALLCSTAIHESGHLLMGKIRKINLRELRLGVFGASLFPDSMNYSYKDEIILCAGGPLFNFLSAVLAVKVFSFSFDSLFVMSSFSLCILNLMPIMGFDGGRILSATLNGFLPVTWVWRVMKLISFVFIFALWCMSLYLLMRAASSLALFVFCIAMFAKIFMPDSV